MSRRGFAVPGSESQCIPWDWSTGKKTQSMLESEPGSEREADLGSDIGWVRALVSCTETHMPSSRTTVKRFSPFT